MRLLLLILLQTPLSISSLFIFIFHFLSYSCSDFFCLMALFKSHIFVKLEGSSVRESGRGLTEIVVSIYAYILFFFTAGR